MSNRTKANMILVKTVEEVDIEAAIKIVSDPNLDGRELSELLQSNFDGNIVYKESGQPLRLDSKVLVAGLLNRLKQLDNETK